MRNWNYLKRLAAIGEDIIKKHLIIDGYQVSDWMKDDSHPCDILCTKKYGKIKLSMDIQKKWHLENWAYNKSSDSAKVWNLEFLDVKTNRRMDSRNGTGIDVYRLIEYIDMIERYNMKMRLYFVDYHEKEQRIYWQYINVLQNSTYEEDGRKYPYVETCGYSSARGRRDGPQMIWNLNQFIPVRKLTRSELDRIDQLPQEE